MTASARSSAPGTGALGLYARSFHKGEGVHRRAPGGDRPVRYKLHEVVRRLMYTPGLPQNMQHRVCSCRFRRNAPEVTGRLNKATGLASFIGLETCRSVWMCPLCSGFITEERRIELQLAITSWKKQGGEIYLGTHTFPHLRADRLTVQLARMRDAMKQFNKDRRVLKARRAAGYVGQIRALEVTWGSWHGWHPHFHFLLFCRPGQLGLLKTLETAWVDALLKVGLAEKSQLNDMLRGAGGESPAFDVQNGDYAAEYVAKFGHDPSMKSKIETGETWGAAAELTKGMSKTGRRLSGITPFTLLAVVAGTCEVRGLTKGRAAALFSEFALAFKGQRQLYWSPRLRDVLNMGKLFTDEELIDLAEKKPEFLDVCKFKPRDWALVLAHRAYVDVLRAIEEGAGDAAPVEALIAELRQRPPIHPPGVSRWKPDGSFAAGLDTPREPWPKPGRGVLLFGNPYLH